MGACTGKPLREALHSTTTEHAHARSVPVRQHSRFVLWWGPTCLCGGIFQLWRAAFAFRHFGFCVLLRFLSWERSTHCRTIYGVRSQALVEISQRHNVENDGLAASGDSANMGTCQGMADAATACQQETRAADAWPATAASVGEGLPFEVSTVAHEQVASTVQHGQTITAAGAHQMVLRTYYYARCECNACKHVSAWTMLCMKRGTPRYLLHVVLHVHCTAAGTPLGPFTRRKSDMRTQQSHTPSLSDVLRGLRSCLLQNSCCYCTRGQQCQP